MPGVRLNYDVDDLVTRYLAGETVNDLARQAGGHPESVRRAIKKAGAMRTSAEASRALAATPAGQASIARALAASNVVRRIDLPAAEVLAAYAEGASLRTIAAQHGVGERPVLRVLREAGVSIRDMSAAGLARWEHLPQHQRDKATADLERARREHPLDRTAAAPKAAATKQRKDSQRVGAWEVEVAQALEDAGLQTARQVAVGPYNLDVSIEGVAVEVHTSMHGPHLNRRHIHDRVDHLADRGWSTLYVWCPRGITAEDMEQVVTCAQLAQGDPPSPGEYLVLRCRGQRTPRRGANRYQGSFVATTGRVADLVA